MTSFSQISVEELAQRLATLATEPLPDQVPEPLQLIDVREPQEIDIASLPAFQVLPLSQFGEWSGQITMQLDPHAETIVMCHHGMRSAQMCQWLVSQGFTNVKNLVGGIDAYSMLVDPSIPRY